MTSRVDVGGLPPPDVPLPSAVRRLAGGDPIRPVWLNDVGGLTCEIGSGRRRRFVKWAPNNSGLDLAAEAARMRWAGPFIAVPTVLDEGRDGDGAWLVTAALPGEMAVVDRWKREPATAVAGIGTGLRTIHDAMPVAECPFTWSAEERVADAHRRVAEGAIDPSDWNPDYQHLALADALDRLADTPPVDELVVCHGDACSPNTLLDDEGRCCGHVDLGWLGVADRWADLAIATWSVTWNYGPEWEQTVLDAYGVDADPQRTSYYRLLWEFG